jgi:hypothetical protein
MQLLYEKSLTTSERISTIDLKINFWLCISGRENPKNLAFQSIFGSNVSVTAQWKIIRITSMEVDFWGVKSSGCENSHATEVKCSNIPQKN